MLIVVHLCTIRYFNVIKEFTMPSLYRRRLLRHSLAAIAAALAPSIATARPSRPMPSVIVIGAGIAGIAAAQRLQRAGCRVTVIEARQRLGGRIWTDRSWPDAPVDLGASIHGVHNNPVAALAPQLDIPTTVYDAGTLSNNLAESRLYDADGAPVTAAWRRQLPAYQDQLADRMASIAEKKAGTPLSMHDALRQALQDSALPAGRKTAAFELFSRNVEEDYGASVDEIAAWALQEGSGFGGREVVFPGGYGQLAERLAQGLAVLTGHVVEHIDY